MRGKVFVVMWLVFGVSWSLAQQPGPDTPYPPFIPYVFSADGGEVWTGSLDDPVDVTGPLCPFVIDLDDELELFEAHCGGGGELAKEVFVNDDGIVLPPDCPVRFRVRGHKEGVLVHRLCPVVLRFYRGDDII